MNKLLGSLYSNFIPKLSEGYLSVTLGLFPPCTSYNLVDLEFRERQGELMEDFRGEG